MPYGLFFHLANFHLLIHSKYEFDLISHANEHTYIIEKKKTKKKQVYFTASVHFDFKLRNLDKSSRETFNRCPGNKNVIFYLKLKISRALLNNHLTF